MTISTTVRHVGRGAARRPSFAQRRRRPHLVLLAAGLLCGTMAGCDAGQQAETLHVIPDTPGVAGTVGPMVLDDVFLETAETVPAGNTVALRGSFTNQSLQPDRLVAVATPAATSVELLDPDGTVATGGIVVPAEGQVDGTTGPVLIRLSGLTRALSPQAIVPVTFEFTSAGRVTLDDVPATMPATMPTTMSTGGQR
jgi:copper(I)-binding protein